MATLTFGEICEAAAVLNGIACVTPVLTSSRLNDASGASVFLKSEHLQKVGAFKFRGAYYAVSRMALARPNRPIVTVSSGNHAQGVALACRLHGLQVHAVMPNPVSRMKREAVVSYGATVHEMTDRKAADDRASSLCQELDAAMVHPYNDLDVMAGQGTTMLELFEQVPQLDAVLVPVGGGGLLSGVCVAAHALDPNIELYACEPTGALDAMYSVRENRIVPMTDPCTIADGLRTSLGARALPILRDHVTGFFVVSEAEIVTAMRFVFERLKHVIEPSSAVAIAPLLRREPALAGKRVGVILTGGNLGPTDQAQWLSGVSS